ncbi:MAG: hypothetical protein AAGD04_00115 [Pseudomonadota bacterium]
MTLTSKALILAASFAAVATTSAFAMEAEADQLAGAVMRELSLRGLPTDSVMDLTIAQIQQLKQIFANSDSSNEMTSAAKSILQRAGQPGQ